MKIKICKMTTKHLYFSTYTSNHKIMINGISDWQRVNVDKIGIWFTRKKHFYNKLLLKIDFFCMMFMRDTVIVKYQQKKNHLIFAPTNFFGVLRQMDYSLNKNNNKLCKIIVVDFSRNFVWSVLIFFPEKLNFWSFTQLNHTLHFFFKLIIR